MTIGTDPVLVDFYLRHRERLEKLRVNTWLCGSMYSCGGMENNVVDNDGTEREARILSKFTMAHIQIENEPDIIAMYSEKGLENYYPTYVKVGYYGQDTLFDPVKVHEVEHMENLGFMCDNKRCQDDISGVFYSCLLCEFDLCNKPGCRELIQSHIHANNMIKIEEFYRVKFVPNQDDENAESCVIISQFDPSEYQG